MRDQQLLQCSISRITRTLVGICAGTLLSCLLCARAVTVASDLDVVPADEVNWGYLNPARGDKSPRAANLWGDRTRNTPTGMLVQFNKGFSSPPHIHNVTYRGVVIEGLLHNDDPAAEKMWMPPGSFWTQPAGANHITAADGERNLIYLEIDSGPYLVKPTADQFNNGEVAVNVAVTNLVWLDASTSKAVDGTAARISYLWGGNAQGETGGSLLKLPSGYDGGVLVSKSDFKAVVIRGEVLLYPAGHPKKRLLPGSYFGSGSNQPFKLRFSASRDSLIYIRANNPYQIF